MDIELKNHKIVELEMKCQELEDKMEIYIKNE